MNSTAVAIKLYGLNIGSIKSNKNDYTNTYNLNIRGVNLSVTSKEFNLFSEDNNRLKEVYDACEIKLIHEDGKIERYNLKELVPMMLMTIPSEKRYSALETIKYKLTDNILIVLENNISSEQDEFMSMDSGYNLYILYETEALYRFNVKELNNAFKY